MSDAPCRERSRAMIAPHYVKHAFFSLRSNTAVLGSSRLKSKVCLLGASFSESIQSAFPEPSSREHTSSITSSLSCMATSAIAYTHYRYVLSC